MTILATLAGSHNLFSNLPTTTPPRPSTVPHPNSQPAPKPPIPVPKYPPPSKSKKRQTHRETPPKSQENPALKTHHHNSKYYKPVKPGQVIPTEGDRAIVVGDNGVSYRLPGAPFEFQFSYSETPQAKPLAMREPAFLPFAPPTMPRPWTGKAPLKKSKRKIKLFEPLVEPGGRSNDDEVKRYEMLKAYDLGRYPSRPRHEVLGKPLTRAEIRELLKLRLSSNRQVNLGRDGVTHNMLELIHTHWRKQPVCKVRCLGVPTVDMDKICSCLEEKTGGKIIHQVGGVVYIFRGRNYDHRARPQYPVMLWKPATPVYPKLIQEAPEGLTKEEADDLRMKGKNLLPICKLAKNGVYISLVRDVRNAFEVCPLVKIDCKGMHASDYKKLGAKLKELVPCVLLSFDDEQILMWRGKDWKSKYRSDPATINPAYHDISTAGSRSSNTQKSEAKSEKSSPRMMSFWQSAIDSGKAYLLGKADLDPEELLEKVEEFESISRVVEHSYPALVMSSEDYLPLKQHNSGAENNDYSEVETYSEEFDDDDDSDISDSFAAIEPSIPRGFMPTDSIVKQLSDIED